jgi:hypothetical protein
MAGMYGANMGPYAPSMPFQRSVDSKWYENMPRGSSDINQYEDLTRSTMEFPENLRHDPTMNDVYSNVGYGRPNIFFGLAEHGLFHDIHDEGIHNGYNQ